MVDPVYELPFPNPRTHRADVRTGEFENFSRAGAVLAVPVSACVVRNSQSPGGSTASVAGRAEAPVLKTDSPQVARNFQTQPAADLPLSKRSSESSVGLGAGLRLPAQTFSALGHAQGTCFLNSNGQDNSPNNTIVDGVEVFHMPLALSVSVPSAEDVEEVHVSTNAYSPPCGRAGAAVVNAVTRSGTGPLHGISWEFHRVADPAARDVFNQVTGPKPRLTQNLFRAAVRGPTVKAKASYFLAYPIPAPGRHPHSRTA